MLIEELNGNYILYCELSCTHRVGQDNSLVEPYNYQGSKTLGISCSGHSERR